MEIFMTDIEKTAEAAENTLSERIEAARVRSSELAETAADRAREFVNEHPVAAIAGGIAIGALIAGAFARRPITKYAAAKFAAHKVDRAVDVDAISKRLSQLAALGADLALAYAARAATAGKDGVGKLETQLGHLSEDASEKGAAATRKAASLADVLINSMREAAETALERVKKQTR
jgi:ElaB/YqjD/DUF883 family membrane-anchored ribosome-binding protein